ncbi:aldo-keto reductase [Leptodontidium sp. 2 PMI_412]|nr:aldo-keto reductase [Leptodontidium sp. 2 PMI_412]
MSSKLPTRQLGRDGPLVTAQGLGLMGLSMFYNTLLPDEDRLKFLDYAFESGVTFWDSADVYADSEDIIGRWLKKSGKRSGVFLATKFGIRAAGMRNDPAYIRAACQSSLQRLGLEPGDSIDLYYCHRIDPSQPIETTVTTMAELKNEGKIKYLGLSECSAATLRRACKVHHIAAVQVEFSPFSMDIEHNGLLEACRELGVAVVAYSPFSRGFLTGQLKSHDDFGPGDRRSLLPRFSKENFSRNLKLVEKITEMAKKKGCTSGQLTLAWLMSLGDDILPIPGTTKTANLDENLGSFGIKLTESEVAEVRQTVQDAEVTGDRHPASMLPYLYVDTAPLSE